MFFLKSVILDLDNTLYDYEVCNNYALESTFIFLKTEYNLSNTIEQLFDSYYKINTNLKLVLGNTASSHNRTIYFKNLLKELNLPLSEVIKIKDYYWTKYHEKMILNDGVLEFLNYLKLNKIKIYVLTDFTLTEQLEKLKLLGIDTYVDNIISSEEVGVDKPNPTIFLHMLNTISNSPSETIMIGDSKNKDIIGAENVGITGILYENNFKQILEKFMLVNNSIIELVNLSKKYGERFDLIQYGGGNISVKTESNLMFIKSSGISLSEVEKTKNYSIINNKELNTDLINGNYFSLDEYLFINKNKPSMETYMHSFMNKYVVHLHPLKINSILSSIDCEETLKTILKSINEPYLLIDYFTPGIDLAKEIKSKYNNEKIIFLKNHGIIFTSNNINELEILIDTVINLFECDNKYKVQTVLSKVLFEFNNEYNYVTYICDKIDINHIFYDYKTLFPDQFIFCGYEPLFVANTITIENIIEYHNKFGKIPSLVIINEQLYIISTSINRCKGIEDVLLSYLQIKDSSTNLVALSDIELSILDNLDTEKYRSNLK